jgi:hypothetical protein
MAPSDMFGGVQYSGEDATLMPLRRCMLGNMAKAPGSRVCDVQVDCSRLLLPWQDQGQGWSWSSQRKLPLSNSACQVGQSWISSTKRAIWRLSLGGSRIPYCVANAIGRNCISSVANQVSGFLHLSISHLHLLRTCTSCCVDNAWPPQSHWKTSRQNNRCHMAATSAADLHSKQLLCGLLIPAKAANRWICGNVWEVSASSPGSQLCGMYPSWHPAYPLCKVS